MVDLVRSGTSADIHLCNAYTLALADQDPAFKEMLRRSARNYPDGKSVVWANKILHRTEQVPPNRVYGPDLFLDVLALTEGTGIGHYLLGATPDTLRALSTQIRLRFPATNLVGSYSPPFRPLTRDEVAEQDGRICESGAHVVWVGLGTPKQDVEAARLASALPVVAVAVGAAFDFIAGSKRQAPTWMQDAGLEWAYRLGSEPSRLWRRYLFGNARFIRAVARGAARSSNEGMAA